ncbi:MAG: patatin-like phospholipase family protein [Polyangiaceae bacterium]
MARKVRTDFSSEHDGTLEVMTIAACFARGYASIMVKETALILAGAVAKGAFEAGALEVLSERAADLGITRVVGASAGALNASVFAVGLRARAERRVATKLCELWADAATWHNVVDFNLRDALALKGVGTADRVLTLMQNAVANVGSSSPRELGLWLVVTALRGARGSIGGAPATTFEQALDFYGAALDGSAQHTRIFQAALASAAFPVLFAPVELPSVGACVDGGTVNNAPIRLALEGSAVERIVVISPQPLLERAPEPLSGVNLLGQVANIAINERLYRDLHDAESVNARLRALEALQADGVPLDAIERVKRALGWRPLEIIQIRPQEALQGNVFEGFGNHTRRLEYIEAGRTAARAQLGKLVSAPA